MFDSSLQVSYGLGDSDDAVAPNDDLTKMVSGALLDLDQLRAKADSGDPEAQYHLGTKYEYGECDLDEDFSEAFRLYSLSAVQGFAEAMICQGQLLEEGAGCQQDDAQAFNVYQTAAQEPHNNATAQFFVAKCLRDGVGCSPNRKLACVWAAKAAKRDHKNACFFLYKACGDESGGLGLAHDEQKARTWLEKAAELGHARAQIVLDP